MKIIGYSSLDRALITSPGPRALDISGEIALTLGQRGCAGRWEGETYVPCDSDVAPACDRCGGAAADPCVMCRGVCRKPAKTCLEEHSVYLAVFSPGKTKIGVSKARRLEARLAEQGASAGCEIARLPDGEAARRLEASLRSRYPDRMTFEEKLVAGPVDDDLAAIAGRYEVIRTLRFRHFPRDPWMRPIVIPPREGLTVSGRTFGVRGQALVLETLGSLYAISLDALTGYDCELKKGRQSLQSTLHTY